MLRGVLIVIGMDDSYHIIVSFGPTLTRRTEPIDVLYTTKKEVEGRYKNDKHSTAIAEIASALLPLVLPECIHLVPLAAILELYRPWQRQIPSPHDIEHYRTQCLGFRLHLAYGLKFGANP
jgi:hypothetical protein